MVKLSFGPEKTKIAKFKEGFAFLGFTITHRARKIRSKSLERFKDRIRELTIRSRNLDAAAISRINAVFRGDASSFNRPRTKAIILFYDEPFTIDYQPPSE
jgi:hypothetical protein